MKRGCGSHTDVMLAHSLYLSVWLLVAGYRCHCFHSISQWSALVMEKCFSILELCLCHIKASSLSCRFFINLRICVRVCVLYFLYNTCLQLLQFNFMVHGFLMSSSVHAQIVFVCAEYWESWWIYFRLKDSLSKGIALVWQQTFKVCWKHSHQNKESFIKSKLARFTNWMQTPFFFSVVFRNWQKIFFVAF